MNEYILLTICIAITTFLGWNIVFLISGRLRKELSVLECLGLSYLFGFGIVSIQMFIMSLFKIDFTTFNILVWWIPVVVGTVFVITKRMSGRLSVSGVVSRRKPSRLKRLRSYEVLLICLIIAQVLYNFFRAMIKPIEAYDAVSIYGLKSKIIYISGGITQDFFKLIASDFHGAHPDYPLLIPLSETWVYTFLNSFNDLAVKTIFPLFLVSFLFIFYAVLKRATNSKSLSILFTFGLVSIKQFSDYSTIGVADLALGIYFAVSIFYICLWQKEKRPSFLNISLVSSVLCLWTKNEGGLACLISLLILFFYALSNIKNINKKHLLHVGIYIMAVLFFIGCWISFKNLNGLVNENFNLSMVSVKNIAYSLNKIPIILYGYQKEIFGFKKWNLVWVLLMLALFLRYKRVFSKDTRYVTLTIILFGAGYFFMYVFSAAEIGFFVSKTASRFLIHILPVAMFWLALVISYTRSTGSTASVRPTRLDRRG